jgi:hypothetical protein
LSARSPTPTESKRPAEKAFSSTRDALVAEIKTTLNDAIFGDRKLGEHRVESLVRRAETLLGHRVDEDND